MYVWVLQRTEYNCFSVLLIITIQNTYVCDDLWSYSILNNYFWVMQIKGFFLNQSVGFIGEMWHILESASVGVAWGFVTGFMVCS